jgi:hypothetical protein
MTEVQPASAFDALRRVILATGGAGLTDGQLLDLFVTQREGAAF